MGYYVHHIPGRLRVRIPEIRNNARKTAEVKELLDIYGVEHLKVNHLTGSVVVTFDPDLNSAEQFLNLLKDRGLFSGEQITNNDGEFQRISNKAASKMGRAFFGYAVGKALEASGFPLLAALI
jgi:hypothetical protein